MRNPEKILKAIHHLGLNYNETCMPMRHYAEIIGVMMERSPTNVLIIGGGNDVMLWSQINVDGRTVVMETDKRWAKISAALGAEVITYTCNTKYPDWHQDPVATLSNKIDGIDWSIIVVDGPAAYKAGHYGRQSTIRLASEISSKSTVIFVHDYNRTLDRKYSDFYLGNPSKVVPYDHKKLAVWDNGKNKE